MIDYASKASIGLLKRISAGSFRMGSRFHRREYPPKVAYVPEFHMAHVPVTVNQFSAFIDAKAYSEQRWWSEAGWDWVNGKTDGWGREIRTQPDGWITQKNKFTHPITGVTAFEAEAYCAWLSALKNRSIRLPTEEEWEYAARGQDGRPFPWGEQFHETFTNLAENGNFSTVDVGSIAGDISPFGVMDMCGNVQEWTSSTYTPLPNESAPPGQLRVARGGSFNDTVYGSRTSYRRGYPPGYFYPFLGFRLVVGIV